VAAAIGASALSLVHRFFAARHFVAPRLSRDEYRLGLRELPGLLRFGLKATPGQIATGISQQGGIWAIGVVAPVAVVGAYRRAVDPEKRAAGEHADHRSPLPDPGRPPYRWRRPRLRSGADRLNPLRSDRDAAAGGGDRRRRPHGAGGLRPRLRPRCAGPGAAA